MKGLPIAERDIPVAYKRALFGILSRPFVTLSLFMIFIPPSYSLANICTILRLIVYTSPGTHVKKNGRFGNGSERQAGME
jgi:hypothetical protein